MFPVRIYPKCQRREAEKRGRAGPGYNKPHQRDRAECKFYEQPIQESKRIMKPEKKTGTEVTMEEEQRKPQKRKISLTKI